MIIATAIIALATGATIPEMFVFFVFGVSGCRMQQSLRMVQSCIDADKFEIKFGAGPLADMRSIRIAKSYTAAILFPGSSLAAVSPASSSVARSKASCQQFS